MRTELRYHMLRQLHNVNKTGHFDFILTKKRSRLACALRRHCWSALQSRTLDEMDEIIHNDANVVCFRQKKIPIW